VRQRRLGKLAASQAAALEEAAALAAAV